VDTVLQQEIANRTETITHIVAKILLTKYERVQAEQFVLFWGLIKDFLSELEPKKHDCVKCPARFICPRFKEGETQYIY